MRKTFLAAFFVLMIVLPARAENFTPAWGTVAGANRPIFDFEKSIPLPTQGQLPAFIGETPLRMPYGRALVDEQGNYAGYTLRHADGRPLMIDRDGSLVLVH